MRDLLPYPTKEGLNKLQQKSLFPDLDEALEEEVFEDEFRVNDQGDTVIPKGEAALITCNEMRSLQLLLPKGKDDDETPPLAAFLAAVMVRADQERGFVDDMLQWWDERHKRVN